MYAIFQVIYGHPFTDKEYGDCTDEDNPFPHLFEDGADGFHEYCSGSGYSRGFGIELAEFDETNYTYVDKLKLAPDADDLRAYKEAYDELPVAAQAVIDKLGPPRVFFLPTTS